MQNLLQKGIDVQRGQQVCAILRALAACQGFDAQEQGQVVAAFHLLVRLGAQLTGEGALLHTAGLGQGCLQLLAALVFLSLLGFLCLNAGLDKVEECPVQIIPSLLKPALGFGQYRPA